MTSSCRPFEMAASSLIRQLRPTKQLSLQRLSPSSPLKSPLSRYRLYATPFTNTRHASTATAAHTQSPKASSPASTVIPPASISKTKPSLPPLPEINGENGDQDASHIDWSKSFHGLSAEPFAKEAAEILLSPLEPEDIEVKPDGILYLPEIKYRRILNKAFGPGGWGLAPRGETIVTEKAVTREYALLAHGRLVSIARGEQDYFSKDNIPTASEGCKSNALMRCCKDLGVASELWDPRFIRKFKTQHTREVFVEHVVSKKKTKITIRKGDAIGYPWKETKAQF